MLRLKGDPHFIYKSRFIVKGYKSSDFWGVVIMGR